MSKVYRIVGLPDSDERVLEVETTYLGASETQLTYTYYMHTGAKLELTLRTTDYWGRIEGVRVLRDVNPAPHDGVIAQKELNP